MKVKPEKTADSVVVGVRWRSRGRTGSRRSSSACTDEEGRDRLRRIGSGGARAARGDRGTALLPLLDNAPDRRFSEPNRWGGGEFEESAVRPELAVEVRYDKVQGRRFRHEDEAHSVPETTRNRGAAPGGSLLPPRPRDEPGIDALLAS